jgi:cardiolipin synthase A/B
MITPLRERLKRRLDTRSRLLAERASARTAGAALIPGNAVRLLKDAAENYPAWLAALEAAEHTIHFESYIIHEDEQGRRFAEVLKAKARAGVRVRLIYDWMGALNATSNRFWRALREAGVEVRCFNPPGLTSPFSWLGRDHRKMITVDGRIGFVAGLCVGRMWVGEPDRGVDPWRDTGVEVLGPAVAEIDNAFAQMWALCGEPLPPGAVSQREELDLVGDVAVRVVAGAPNSAGLYRLDQMIAAAVRKRWWLTDAYFAATTPYVQALRAAAADGVDVRLLVPQATDIPVMRALSRTGYRSLLEAGVRVFEWNGSMLHAKTAVADGCWTRVGSTNLNLASWLSNWELDVIIEDERFGVEMEEVYLNDLANATEIVLTARNRVALINGHRKRPLRQQLRASGSGRAAAGAVRLGNAMSAAITNHRVLSPSEARITAGTGLLLVLLAVIAIQWPLVLTAPLAVLCVWLAITMFVRAYALHQEGKRELQGTARLSKPPAVTQREEAGKEV